MSRPVENEKQHPSGPIIFGVIVAVVVLIFAALFILRPGSTAASSSPTKMTSTPPVSSH